MIPKSRLLILHPGWHGPRPVPTFRRMTKLILVLLVGLMCEAVGVVFLSKAIKEIGEVKQVSTSEIWRLVKAGATNSKMLAGIALEAVFFGVLLYLMSQADLSFVWPMTALSFVFTCSA